MHKRTREIRQFDIGDIRNEQMLTAVICISGWLDQKEDTQLPWSPLCEIYSDIFYLSFEENLLMKLGKEFRSYFASILKGMAGRQILQLTILAPLLSAITWPVLLLKAGSVIDNRTKSLILAWVLCMDRAKKAGVLLARVLVERSLGQRPVTGT